MPASLRTLRALEARDEATLAQRESQLKAYLEMRDERTGSAAVAGAQSTARLRQADVGADLGGAQEIAEQGDATRRAARAQTRIIHGQAFFENDGVWVDARVQGAGDAVRKQLRFDSEEHYALQRGRTDVAAWLSLGRRVDVLVDGVVYEVVE